MLRSMATYCVSTISTTILPRRRYLIKHGVSAIRNPYFHGSVLVFDAVAKHETLPRAGYRDSVDPDLSRFYDFLSPPPVGILFHLKKCPWKYRSYVDHSFGIYRNYGFFFQFFPSSRRSCRVRRNIIEKRIRVRPSSYEHDFSGLRFFI